MKHIDKGASMTTSNEIERCKKIIELWKAGKLGNSPQNKRAYEIALKIIKHNE